MTMLRYLLKPRMLLLQRKSIIFQIKTPQHYTNYSLHTAVSLMLLVHVQNDIDNMEEISESAEPVEESFDEAFCHTDTAEI